MGTSAGRSAVPDNGATGKNRWIRCKHRKEGMLQIVRFVETSEDRFGNMSYMVTLECERCGRTFDGQLTSSAPNWKLG